MTENDDRLQEHRLSLAVKKAVKQLLKDIERHMDIRAIPAIAMF